MLVMDEESIRSEVSTLIEADVETSNPLPTIPFSDAEDRDLQLYWIGALIEECS